MGFSEALPSGRGGGRKASSESALGPPSDRMSTRILQTMVCGIPLVLGLGTSM